MAVAARKRGTLSLTIEDCDRELARYHKELLGAKDEEGLAVARYQIDRWLDRRLLLTSPAEEWEG